MKIPPSVFYATNYFLICYQFTALENKVANKSEIVSELVETVFGTRLLRRFTVHGLQGNKNFKELKINSIFLSNFYI